MPRTPARLILLVVAALTCAAMGAHAEVRVRVERNQKEAANADFHFQNIPALSDTDAGQDATLEVIDGRADWGSDARQLVDGIGPTDANDYGRTFHFGQTSARGRLRMDFGVARAVLRVNTYSWNPGARAPQVYVLYGSDGTAENFSPAPGHDVDPASAGWRLIAAVDTRPKGFLKSDGGGGQYGVSIANDSGGPIANVRYLLWDVQATNDDRTEATAYAEFDVIIANAPSPTRLATVHTRQHKTFSGAARFEGETLVISDKSGEQRLNLADVADVSFRDPPPTTEADDDAPSAGGLKGEYFDDQEFQKPKLVRYDPTINFKWGLAAPDPSVAVDFAVRWTGSIEPKYSEVYTFYTRADDGVRLWIDGKPLVDRWDDQPPYEQQGQIALKAGHKYDVRIDYHDKMAEARMQLEWSSASQPKQIVPASQLSPPAADGAKAAPPRVTLTSPKPQRWTVAPGSVELEAMAETSTGTVARVEFYSGNMLLGTATTRPYRSTWVHPNPGHHKLTARATDAAGTVASSPPVTLSVAANGSGSLPVPWGALRLGPMSKSDTSTYSGGLFTIRAGGGELRGAFDSGYFIAQPLDGDGQITARVGEIVNEDSPNAVTGVMIRETLAGDSRYAALITGKEGTEFLRRWEPASWVSAIDAARSVPCFLRLVRSGKTFKAYVSENGSSWQAVGSEQVPLGSQAYVGLITTSRSEEGMCHVAIDHVQVQEGGVPMEATTSGIKTRAGSFLAGEILKADDQQIVLSPKRGPKITFAPADVARVVFKPIPTELAANFGTGRTGVLLSTGDFFEGEFREYRDAKASVDSVVFGIKTFESHEVLAAILHNVAHAPAAAVRVRIADGSVYLPTVLKLENGRLQFTDPTAGDISVSVRDVAEIAR